MKLGPKSLGDYCSYVQKGILILLGLTIIRFLMLPVFGIPYQQGTTYTSSTIALLILVLYYVVRASREAGTRYRDILGIVFVLSLSQGLMIAAAILVDDLAGIDTYFTDSVHSGGVNSFVHATTHVVGTILPTLIFWGLGSLILLVLGKRSKVTQA